MFVGTSVKMTKELEKDFFNLLWQDFYVFEFMLAATEWNFKTNHKFTKCLTTSMHFLKSIAFRVKCTVYLVLHWLAVRVYLSLVPHSFISSHKGGVWLPATPIH